MPARAVMRMWVTALPLLLVASCGIDLTPVGSSPTPEPTVSTSPFDGINPFRFAVIGDFGSGDSNEQAIAERMCDWRKDHPFDVVITTGDNVYPNGSRVYFDRAFFRPMACLLNDDVDFHASLGNHDIVTDNGSPELEEAEFGMDGHNYVYRAGGVRFVIADSNRLNRDWLRSALKPRPADSWTIVVFHHPVFSPGPHGSTPGFRPGLPRLFRRRDVDLVLNGHDHMYAVSKPLRKIRYVVTGGGGAALYRCGSGWFVAKCVSRHHFLYVAADHSKSEIRVKAVPSEGRPFARFSTEGR